MFALARTCTSCTGRNGLSRRLLMPTISNRFLSTQKAQSQGKGLSVPIIDIGKLGLNYDPDPDDGEWHRVAQEITDAFQNVGFTYISGHGFPQAQVNRLTKAGSAFFDLPLEEKMKYIRDLDKVHGYLPLNSEQLDSSYSYELRESYDLRNGQFFYPDGAVPDFRPASVDFLDNCRKLTNRILVTLAIGLDLPRKFFLDAHQHIGGEGNRTIGRVIHYPPIPKGTSDTTIRIAPHSDITTVTLLFQDQIGGLQIEDQNGEWSDAAPVPGTVVVNIGDLLHFWTQGKLKATRHRVVMPQEGPKKDISRRSLTYFVGLDDEVVIRPLDGSSTFEPITVKDYLYKRLGEIYHQ